MEMFEKASKSKLRFTTVRGQMSTEDLWEMPLTATNGWSLDDLAKALNKEVKESGEESFVLKKSYESTVASLKFEIVKHVIAVKIAAAEKSEAAAVNRDKKHRILEIIASKQDQKLMDASEEDLNKMIEDL